MTMFALMLLGGFLHCIHAISNNSPSLTANQTEIWSNVVSQINSINQTPRIYIVQVGHTSEISLYHDDDRIPPENRHLFKQNIHKQIDCLVYENRLNSIRPSNVFDPCHGILSIRNARPTIAGTYVYTTNEVSYSLGLILTEMPTTLYWFDHTKPYVLNKSSSINNGTQLLLGFQWNIYYNSNSDLFVLNEYMNDTVEQAHVSIQWNEEDNLQNFFLMENLICQRYQAIVYDDLRMMNIVCTTKVTFQCPLQSGSSCWLENKRLSNIQFNIDSQTFFSSQTITVRIDV